MVPVLLLFDIDGTLMDGGGSGRWAMEAAFAHVTGALGVGQDLPTAGRTDPAILHDMAARAGVPSNGPAMAAVVDRYLSELPGALTARGASDLPGVRDLLELLAGEPGCRLAVGTGNLAAGARLKLEHIALGEHFPTGGFGDGETVRAVVIATARRNASRHYGHPFAPHETVVIGDAVADIEAARANGMRVLSVATGRTPAEALAAQRPDALVPDLRDRRRIAAWLCAPAG